MRPSEPPVTGASRSTPPRSPTRWLNYPGYRIRHPTTSHCRLRSTSESGRICIVRSKPRFFPFKATNPQATSGTPLEQKLPFPVNPIPRPHDTEDHIRQTNDIENTITNLKYSVCARDLSDVEQIMRDLHSIDWAFTHENTRYLTHDVHPYPAKYIPQIPFGLIAKLSVPGDIVLDPFGGSGTTATEAVHLKRRAISVDANPLAALMGRVKTSTINQNVETQIAHLSSAIDGYISQIKKDGRLMPLLPASPTCCK